MLKKEREKYIMAKEKRVTFSSRRNVFLVEKYDNKKVEEIIYKNTRKAKGSGIKRAELSPVHFVRDFMHKLYTQPQNFYIKTENVGVILFSPCEDEILLSLSGGIIKVFYEPGLDYAAAVAGFRSAKNINSCNSDYVGILEDAEVTFFVFILKDAVPYYEVPTKRTLSCFRWQFENCFIQTDLIGCDLDRYRLKFDAKTVDSCQRAQLMLKYRN
jgi:hypothetical protein